MQTRVLLVLLWIVFYRLYTPRARIKISTSSNWTTLDILNGGAWIQP